MMANFERIRLARTKVVSDFTLLKEAPESIAIEDIISLPQKMHVAPQKDTIQSKKMWLEKALGLDTPA